MVVGVAGHRLTIALHPCTLATNRPTGLLPTNQLNPMRTALLSFTAGCLAIGVGAFAAICSDVAGDQRLSGEQIANLALVALVVPHCGAVTALAASKA